MLHILWMLIKLILILLGTVLGLAVLVLLLLLFCPVRYSAEALKETSSFKETEAAVRVSWLFGGISFTFRRIQGKNTQKLCVFGIPVLSLLQKRKQKKATAGKVQTAEKSPLSEQPTEKPLPETKISLPRQKYPCRRKRNRIFPMVLPKQNRKKIRKQALLISVNQTRRSGLKTRIKYQHFRTN